MTIFKKFISQDIQRRTPRDMVLRRMDKMKKRSNQCNRVFPYIRRKEKCFLSMFILGTA